MSPGPPPNHLSQSPKRLQEFFSLFAAWGGLLFTSQDKATLRSSRPQTSSSPRLALTPRVYFPSRRNET